MLPTCCVRCTNVQRTCANRCVMALAVTRLVSMPERLARDLSSGNRHLSVQSPEVAAKSLGHGGCCEEIPHAISHSMAHGGCSLPPNPYMHPKPPRAHSDSATREALRENMPYLACQWKLWRPGLWVLIHIDELFFASSMTEVMKGASCAPSGRCTFGESTRGVAGQCPACPGLFSRRPSGGPRRRGTMPTQDSGPGLPPGEWLCRPSGGPRRRWRLKPEPCARHSVRCVFGRLVGPPEGRQRARAHG